MMESFSIRDMVDVPPQIVSSAFSSSSDLRVSTPMRSRDSDNPTAEELKKMVPMVFAGGKTLEEYFQEELFISQNLIDLPQAFELQGDYSTSTLKSILQSLNELNKYLDSLDQQLQSNYNLIKQGMKLEILTNVRSFKQLNNSRIMVNGLQSCKYSLQNYLHALKDMDHHVNSICEKLEDTMPEPSGTAQVNKTLVYLINADISKLAKTVLNTIVLKVIKVFEEYVQRFHAQGLADEQVFVYEILSLDDHIKSIGMAHDSTL